MMRVPPARSALFTLLLTVLGLVVLEGLLRLTVPEDDLLFAWERPDGIIDLLGPQVFVRESGKSAGSDGPYDWSVVSDHLGIRASTDTVDALPDGEARLLALGDSWMFGSSITQGQTIPDQIGRLLTEQTGTPTTVVNAGIPGGSGFEMLARWVELSNRLEITGVLLGIPHNVGRQKTLTSAREQLLDLSQGAPYINLRTYLVARRLIVPHTRPRYAEVPSGDKLDDGGTLQDVRTIARQASAQGLPVWMIEWPGNMDRALGAVNPSDPRWRAMLEPEGVVFAGHALNTRACWGFEDHGHPSEAGARAIAEVLTKVMTTDARPKALQVTPLCEDVEGVGPGKPDWPLD